MKIHEQSVVKRYQQKYHNICFICAILFTLADFFVCMIDETVTKSGIADSTLYIPYLLFAIIILPSLCFISWALYIGFYVYQKCESQKIGGNIVTLLFFLISVSITVLVGVGTYNRAIDLVYYITGNRNLLNGLLDCIAFKVAICIGWMFCFVGCVVFRNTFCLEGNSLRKSILCVCACLCVYGLVFFEKSKENYIHERTEWVWMQKMTDYYEEHGIGMDVEPFSRN